MTWGREVLFAANPDLADILGDMDLDFENFHFKYFFLEGIPNLWMSRFPNFQNLVPAGLGPGRAGAIWMKTCCFSNVLNIHLSGSNVQAHLRRSSNRLHKLRVYSTINRLAVDRVKP